MSYHTKTSGSSSAYREWLSDLVAFCTSQSVATVAVNAGGSGYVVGDVVTLSHASGYLSAQFEVTSVSSGAITGLQIVAAGAFSIRATTATVVAGGTGYATNDIIQVQGGTYTQRAKYQVTNQSGGVVQAGGLTLIESGGAYTVMPGAGATTTAVGPNGVSGTGLTVTLASQALIGTTGLSVTGGTGSSATVDITLEATGWTAVRDNHDLSENSVTDEKEIVLQGTVSGADAPYVGFQSFTRGSGASTRYGVALFGMTAYNDSLTFANQPGIGPKAGGMDNNLGSYFHIHEAARNWGISANGRRIYGWINGTDITTSYNQFYVGLLNGFGTSTTSPYPMCVAANSNKADQEVDNIDKTGLSEAARRQGTAGPIYFRRKSDGTWVSVQNATTVQQQQELMWPMCRFDTSVSSEWRNGAVTRTQLHDGTIASNTRANTTYKLYPSPHSGDDVIVLMPLMIISKDGGESAPTVNWEIVGELDGVFWWGGVNDSGVVATNEDYFDQSGVRYRIVGNAQQYVAAKPYQSTVFREN